MIKMFLPIVDGFLCFMQKQLEAIESEVSRKLYKLFLTKFGGNQSAFARASECSETTVRRVFGNKQRMTLSLLLRFCNALEIDASEILAGVRLFKSDPQTTK